MSEEDDKFKVCPCPQSCPLEISLRVIGGHWKMPIMCALDKNGKTRYNELKRKIRGITNTVLASSLKELEEADLVSREEYLEIPVRVEYELTDASRKLMPILSQLRDWALSEGIAPFDPAKLNDDVFRGGGV